MTGGGDLREVIEMQQREWQDDGYGNGGYIGPFQTVFAAAARVQILRGTETVMAGRLAGKQTLALIMRWQPDFATVDTTWRAVNARSGVVYNIRSVEPDERRAFVNVLVEAGVAT
ncbi:head-tail adaptor [Ensifer sp. WSM1721]|uniref:head-tail adaptor protein n=1 Tax=Ensifer sp. WSM1721 TaxID=1041159 RepID=UPI00047C9039|nr:head-tail adaptor protein [Ensifer sp. WSM1721]